MKILYIINGVSLSEGSTKSFISMLTQIQTYGCEVAVVTPQRKGIYEWLKQNNIQTFALHYYFNTKISGNFYTILKSTIKKCFNYYSAVRLKEICEKWKPDIVHSNSSVNDIGYLAAKWLRIPHVWHIREYGDRDFGLNILHLDERLREPLNYSITITKDIAKHKGLIDLPSNRVIYNGIISKSGNLPETIKDNYFLYAGRIEPTKGIEDCINAFIQFKENTKSNVILKVAGTCPKAYTTLKSKLTKKLNEHNLSDAVEWLGVRKDIGLLMSHALATIVPSHFEGFGRVMPEAQTQRCLIIGRNTGGTKEQFDNGLEFTGKEIGIRFETVNELAQCFANVLVMSSSDISEITENAFCTVNNLYTIEENGRRVFNFYNEILNLMPSQE